MLLGACMTSVGGAPRLTVKVARFGTFGEAEEPVTLRQIRLSSRNRRNRPRGPLDISRVGNWAESSLFFVSRKLFAEDSD